MHTVAAMTPSDYGEAVAAEVRAEMARQQKTPTDLASALQVTPATARSRLAGKTFFNVVELVVIASWLGIDVEQLASPGALQQAAS